MTGLAGRGKPRHRSLHLGDAGLAGAELPGRLRLGELGRLPLGSQCIAVAGPGVAVEGPEVRDDPRAERVQVDVADQLQPVRLPLHHDGLVAVLEEVADPLMPPVEGAGVPGQEAPHAPGQGPRPGADEEVGVVREERPGVDGPGGPFRQVGHPGDEVGAISACSGRPIGVFTMTDPAVHDPDPRVHDADLTVHDGLILAFTMERSGCSR